MNKTRIRDRAARAALRIAKRAGVTVTFQNPGAIALTGLYAFIESSVRGAGVNGNVDAYDVQVLIPRQTNFPPTTGISTGATCTVGTRKYAVENADSDFEGITDAATIRLICHVLGNDETIS